MNTCPTCSRLTPTVEQEREIRRAERRFLLGLIAGDFTTAEIETLRASLAAHPASILSRFLGELAVMCESKVTDDRQAAIADRRRKRLGLA